MTKTKLTIATLGNSQPVMFAATELARYIGALTSEVTPLVAPHHLYVATAPDTLWLLEAADAPESLQTIAQALPPVANREWDDAYVVDVEGGRGVILGDNPRSVLLGAYALLNAAGCRWVRPGKEGEVIPSRKLGDISLHKSDAASYRHRGICIEGACSYENVADIIDWAPKVGYSAYFTQFRESYTFFERWYSHRGNPNLSPEPFTVEMARDLLHRLQLEIAKRGLVYHAVGHGWTCEPLGIAGLGWDSKEYQLTAEQQSYLAQVNGVRAIWHGVPLNTNLCYSNAKVRRLIIESIADYTAANPLVDVLHFWLADDSNNQCECENCQKAIPSDFYVQMLNELDLQLSERGIMTRIVFLVYVDLLWPPEKQRLVNPERFILMFAPITRSYTQPFPTGASTYQLPPYQRNKLRFPANVAENVAFLRGWQSQFSGDSFDFDYHLMWDHFNDPSYTTTASILGEDVKRLREIGLNGYMSCQLQRLFFPTSLPMVVLGQTLWDSSANTEAIASDYYFAAYGKAGSQVNAYLTRLGELVSPPYLRGEISVKDEETADNLAQVADQVHSFQPVIAQNRALTSGAQAKSWEYLALHGEYLLLMAEALLKRAQGDQPGAHNAWQEVVQFAWAQEPILQPVFDTFLFVNTLNRRFQ